MKELADEDIIINIKRGKIDHFSFLVKKYTNVIRNYVAKKVFDQSEVDDIVQKALIQFYKAIDRFDENRPVSPYLFQITKNEIKMYFRARKATIQLNDAYEYADDRVEEIDEDDHEKLLDQLTQNEKKAITLVQEGYSYVEISKILKRPLNTTRTIIRRTRLKLKKLKKS